MFKWAREWRGHTIEDAAQKLKTRPENIHAWEAGDGAPTVRQARQLADFYGRAFLEFFLPHPPRLAESKLIPDYRLRREAETGQATRELKDAQEWAEAMRENALDLYSLLGETPPTLQGRLFATVDDNPESAAATARALIGPSIDQQHSVRPIDLPKMLRTGLENAGILVLRDSSLTKLGVRGLCIYSEPLPVVVFGAESPSAQAFTLAHELAHIVLRQSAVSGPSTKGDEKSSQALIEGWCDRFAAAYLIPADALMRIWAKPNAPMAALGDDTLQKFAAEFRMSKHAMLIRLVHLGYVEADYYWNVKKPEFEAEERDYKGFGRTKYYGSRFRSKCGDLYTGLVLEAWDLGTITNHNAAELMGTKSFKHLEDIRREFSVS